MTEWEQFKFKVIDIKKNHQLLKEKILPIIIYN